MSMKGRHFPNPLISSHNSWIVYSFSSTPPPQDDEDYFYIDQNKVESDWAPDSQADEVANEVVNKDVSVFINWLWNRTLNWSPFRT